MPRDTDPILKAKVAAVRAGFNPLMRKRLVRCETAQMLSDTGWEDWNDLPIRLFTESDAVVSIAWSKSDDLWISNDGLSLPFPHSGTDVRWKDNVVPAIVPAIGQTVQSVMLGREGPLMGMTSGYGRGYSFASTRPPCASDKTELFQHRHPVPLFPAFGDLISDNVIKHQSVEPDLLSRWSCLSQRTVVGPFRQPSEGDFVTANHLIFHGCAKVRKRHQETSDQHFES